MKHEYTADELAELKSIYDESGEAGLQIGEMRALRKAGLLTQGLPAKPEEPSKRDLILAHCKKRIDQGQTKLRQVIGGCLARACHAAMGRA